MKEKPRLVAAAGPARLEIGGRFLESDAEDDRPGPFLDRRDPRDRAEIRGADSGQPFANLLVPGRPGTRKPGWSRVRGHAAYDTCLPTKKPGPGSPRGRAPIEIRETTAWASWWS